MSYKIVFKIVVTAAVSMASGSSVVHSYYKPLNDLEDYVQREIEKRRTESDHE